MRAIWCEQCAGLHLPEVAHVAPTGMVRVSGGVEIALVDYCVGAFQAATRRVEHAQEEESRAARDRVVALRALYTRAGLPYHQIARLVGLSTTRVGQLLRLPGS